MTIQSYQESPLTLLVLFIVCLAIAGSVIAGLHYLAVDLPAQKNILTPTNSMDYEVCEIHLRDCTSGCGHQAIQIWKTDGEEAGRKYYDTCNADNCQPAFKTCMGYSG